MKRLLPFIFMSLLFIVACENRPKGVLSTGKMEDVLYDYHIMQGIIDQLPDNEKEDKAQNYINAIFAKHGITEDEFESSVIYYNRHAKELHGIYENIKKRYTAINEEIQLVNGNNDMVAIYATGGDTTNLWSSAKLLILRNKELQNRESFTIHADTSFHRRDQFILTLTPIFFKENRDDYDISLNVGLSVMYKNGKHVGTTRLITGNGIQQITLKAEEGQDIKSVTGFFYYKGKKTMRNLCLIDNISLVRMHEVNSALEVKLDSIKTSIQEKDSLPVDSQERRLTPEEYRLKNQSGELIKIQAAPAVRTPNKYGTRRRSR